MHCDNVLVYYSVCKFVLNEYATRLRQCGQFIEFVTIVEYFERKVVKTVHAYLNVCKISIVDSYSFVKTVSFGMLNDKFESIA